MGIVEGDLAEFELSSLEECKIEQDVSGVIHLHLDSVRLELSPDEFDHFVSVVARGRTELRELKTADDSGDQNSDSPAGDSETQSPTTALTNDQQAALLDSFEAFRNHDIPFVVLRGYDGLPSEISGSDVDLLVDADRFDDAASVLKDRFSPSESKVANGLDIARFAAQNPLVGIQTLRESPDEVVSYLKRNLVATDIASRDYIGRTFERDGLVVHVVNHLAYTSPMNGDRIRVAAAVDDGLLDRRVEHGPFSIPAPPDELVHLVCRGVFDYEGAFPDRYTTRCDELRDIVFDDDAAEATFEALLPHIFYGAAPLVSELVRDGDYQSIRSRLAHYDDY